MLSRTFAALAALSLMAGSSAAVAQSAAPLSVAAGPSAHAEPEGAGELRGRGGWILGAIALGLAIWGLMRWLEESESP